MATLSFAVHVDKENETPAALMHKGHVKTFGPRQGKLSQQTPRKALFDVNNELQLSSKLNRGGKDAGLPGPLKFSGKTRLGNIQDENQNPQRTIKKSEPKKDLSVTQTTIKKTKGPRVQIKADVAVKRQPIQQSQSKPVSQDDEEWDAIFPRQERLSTYVDKLFSWRPPCLFGQIPDSEDEADLSEPEMDFDFDIMDPINVEGFPEDGLDLVVPLPEWECSQPGQESEDSGAQAAMPIHSDLSLLSSPDTSLSLGSLMVMQESSPPASRQSPQPNSFHSS